MIRLPLVLTIALALPAAAQARDYGQQGAVFPVIERDLLEQIHSRLVAMEKSGETAKLNDQLKRRTAARVNRPDPVAGIARAIPATGSGRLTRAAVRRFNWSLSFAVSPDFSIATRREWICSSRSRSITGKTAPCWP